MLYARTNRKQIKSHIDSQVNEAAHIKQTENISNTLVKGIASPQMIKVASVRVSPGGYLSALFVLTVIGTFLFHLRLDKAAIAFLIFGWLLIPILALTDRIVFDGKLISRRGLVALLIRIVKGRKLRLSVDEVERVESMAVRTLIHGGRVHYRYRSEVIGKGLRFVFASGGGSYRAMVRSLFAAIASDKLDMRSCELRDYLVDPKDLDANIAFLDIASNNNSTVLTKAKGKNRNLAEPNTQDMERGILLRQTANQLRAAGRLKQAGEAFRRALTVLPNDNWLMFEFARFLRSHANTLRDVNLLKRSSAALRLASKRAKEDANLLTRIGESYFEFGELESASKKFREATERNPSSFRAEMGLAESGIRHGKLAHVIHHYSSAARVAPDKALKRFVQHEIDYYSTLNSDEDYLDAEIRRIDRLQFILFARRSCVRVTAVAFLVGLLGSKAFDQLLSNVGWTFTATFLGLWFLLVVAGKFYTERNVIPTAE